MTKHIVVSAIVLVVIALVSSVWGQPRNPVPASPPGPPTPPIVLTPPTVEELQDQIRDLRARLGKAERRVSLLETNLQQLQANFAKHTHDYDSPHLGGLVNYASFLRSPDQYKNVLIRFVLPENAGKSGVKSTGPPNY